MKKSKATEKDIHHHLRMVSRLNTILAATGLLAVLVLVAWLKWSGVLTDSVTNSTSVNASVQTGAATPGVQDEPIDQDELTKDYKSELNNLLEGYAFEDASEASALSVKILDLTLPADFRVVQLETVIALDEVQQGQSDAAKERIKRLQTEYNWFLPDTAL